MSLVHICSLTLNVITAITHIVSLNFIFTVSQCLLCSHQKLRSKLHRVGVQFGLQVLRISRFSDCFCETFLNYKVTVGTNCKYPSFGTNIPQVCFPKAIWKAYSHFIIYFTMPVIAPVWSFNRPNWAWWFGKSTYFSNIPGCNKARCSVSGQFGVMIILTLCRISNPSFWFSKSIKVLWISLSADVSSESRWPPMASVSSIKKMHGWWSLA